jgi:protein-S-isoprenylcysteine O-methyltransferase Ste14
MFHRYSQIAARARVPAGFLLAAIYLVFARPTPGHLALGAAVALAGLLLRAASAGRLEKNKSLATSGPYAYTRNPLYLGSALAGIGFSIAGGQWWFLLLLAAFFVAAYWPVMRNEQRHLHQLFGGLFDAYARAVPLLLPRLRPWRAPGASQRRFEWKLYRSNREYEALLAFLVIVLALWGKMLWLGRE